MKTYSDLTPAERKQVISQALIWMHSHNSHVENLLRDANASVAPSCSDLFHPELWKPMHWKWFRIEILEIYW